MQITLQVTLPITMVLPKMYLWLVLVWSWQYKYCTYEAHWRWRPLNWCCTYSDSCQYWTVAGSNSWGTSYGPRDRPQHHCQTQNTWLNFSYMKPTKFRNPPTYKIAIWTCNFLCLEHSTWLIKYQLIIKIQVYLFIRIYLFRVTLLAVLTCSFLGGDSRKMESSKESIASLGLRIVFVSVCPNRAWPNSWSGKIDSPV